MPGPTSHHGPQDFLYGGNALRRLEQTILPQTHHPALLLHYSADLLGRGTAKDHLLYPVVHHHQLVDAHPSFVACASALVAADRPVEARLLTLRLKPEGKPHGLQQLALDLYRHLAALAELPGKPLGDHTVNR